MEAVWRRENGTVNALDSIGIFRYRNFQEWGWGWKVQKSRLRSSFRKRGSMVIRCHDIQEITFANKTL